MKSGKVTTWTVLINTMIPLEHAAARASREATGERPSNVMTKRPDGVRYMALRALDVREGGNPGVKQTLLVQRSFFWSHRG